ncbi:MAG: hypothetical protein FXF54_05005 [Kosmotoga sp.]|nr:MAG: hypothetical protein FXF54_05005 [Kosmotoga sp.]
MKKSILVLLSIVMLFAFATGCTKRVEVQEHGETFVIPEKSKPYMEEAVKAENKVDNLEKEVTEKEETLENAKQELEETKENKADLDKLERIKNSKGKLW